MKDGYGREISYARISVTDRCNLRCLYCMPEEGVSKKEHNDILRFEELFSIVEVLESLGINKIRITGGEPLVRRGIIDFIRKITQLKGIKKCAITTNAVLLDNYAQGLFDAGVTGINISLDTLNPDKYREITRGGNLETVLKGIEHAVNLGFESIKINSVLAKGYNDDEIKNLAELSKIYPVDVRFIELMPMGGCARWSAEHFMPSSEIIRLLPELSPVENEDKSSPAHYYKLPNAIGKVGIINPISCKFCDKCNRIRITADGKIKSCLHSDDEVDLKPCLGDKLKIKNAVEYAIYNKQKEHHLEDKESIHRDMVRIGG
jgi:cyclic pyranopterin phosphate synthase